MTQRSDGHGTDGDRAADIDARMAEAARQKGIELQYVRPQCEFCERSSVCEVTMAVPSNTDTDTDDRYPVCQSHLDELDATGAINEEFWHEKER